MPKKRWRRLKGQATIFVVLGIVLMAVFAFALYARNLLTTGQAQQEADRILTDVIQTNSINYYVENCLEDVSAEALRTAAEQGGMLDAQSLTPWKDYFLYNDSGHLYNVSYAIEPNERCDAVSLLPPQYPRHDTYLDELEGYYQDSVCKYDEQSGFLGMNVLTTLCYQFGANAIGETPGHSNLRCEAYTINDNVQRRLQERIMGDLKECANFTLYEELLGHNVTVHQDEANTTVIYGQDKVHVNVTYPFTVRVSNGQTVVAMHEFSYTSPYRFKKAYEYLMELVKKENKDHNFNLTGGHEHVEGYDPKFDVQVIKDPCSLHQDCPADTSIAAFDDIIRVEDFRHDARVANQTLVLQAAIRNRRPALDYIHATSGNPEYDIHATENETLKISPRAYDPDDMEVSYTYEGWREDWNDTFDFAGYEHCMDNDPEDCKLKDYVITNYNIQPENWTNSQPYLQTGREAEINLTHEDTGPHNITIRTWDDTGLEDHQIVHILVYDLPVARPNGSNLIPSIDDRYASLEDPYLLNGSNSTASQVMGEPLSTWIWSGSVLGDTMFTIEHDGPLYLLPGAGSFYSYTPTWPGPDDITQQPLNHTSNDITGGTGGGLDYRINLTVGTSSFYSDPSHYDLNVYECLPVRNDTHPHPYPYNDTDSTSYDHACCLGTTSNGRPVSGDWGEVAEPNQVQPCYEEWRVGILQELWPIKRWSAHGNPSVKPEVSREQYHHAPPSLENHEIYDNHVLYQNDVFNLTYKRDCDGERGNTCTGDVLKSYRRLEECDDYTHSSGHGYNDDERCYGPDGTTCREYDYDNSYPLRTFEQHYNNQPGLMVLDREGNQPDGICNDERACADPSNPTSYHPYNNPNNGDHRCQGGCAGSDGCTKPVRCSCDETCGATCEEDEHHYYPSSQRCVTDCDDATCDFNKDIQPCPQQCILAVPQNPSTDYANCDQVHDPDLPQHCYYDTDPCKEDDCRLEGEGLLRPDHCDLCTVNGRHDGEFCPGQQGMYDGTCYYDQGLVTPAGTRCEGPNCLLGTHDAATIENRQNTCISNGYDGVLCGQNLQCCHGTENGCITPENP